MKRGRKPVTYTLARAEIVRARVSGGERLTAVCKDLGMLLSNFLRWCRRNRFVVNTPELREANRRLPRRSYREPLPMKLRTPRPGGRAAKMAEDFRAGMAPHLVAARHGVSYAYAARFRREIGLAPPPGRGRNFRRVTVPDNAASGLSSDRFEAIVLSLD